jgi:hypothetical protein
MNYNDLLSAEKDFYEKLSEDERRIYLASQEQLAAIDTWNDTNVHEYVGVSRLSNELDRLHKRYNELTEYVYLQPNATDKQQKVYDNLMSVTDETFCMTISIGTFSTVLDLSCMDECDALYDYLSKVKMSRFNQLCDNFDIAVLIETLVNHDVY